MLEMSRNVISLLAGGCNPNAGFQIISFQYESVAKDADSDICYAVDRNCQVSRCDLSLMSKETRRVTHRDACNSVDYFYFFMRRAISKIRQTQFHQIRLYQLYL